MHRTKLLIVIVVGLLLAVFMFLTGNKTLEVTTNAMYPTIKQGQLVEVDFSKSEPLQRFDIVVFDPERDMSNTLYVSRIIAYPKEPLGIDESGKLLVSGSLINLPDDLDEIEVEDLHSDVVTPSNLGYFLLNDNLAIPQDSRHFGRISENEIKGKVNIEPHGVTGQPERTRNAE